MEKKEKEAEISELRKKFSRANATILGEYRGLTVSEIDKLRNAIRKASGELRVAKNTLARIASKGTGIEKLESHLSGPTAIILSYSDQAAVAKALTEFAKEQEKFKIKVGVLGSNILDAKGINALAELPGIDRLRARILGLINAPASRLARLMATPGTRVAQALKAHSEKS